MSNRTVEDRLREEYFQLLPFARLILDELETEVRHRLLSLSHILQRYEKIEVHSRIKDCESALAKLRRRTGEGATFDPDKADSYSLTTLRDLVGVRVLVFPLSRLFEVDAALRRHEQFSSWEPDPIIKDGTDETLAFKYHGYCSGSTRVRAELQVVPMLIGLFWEVEHAAIYKPSPRLRGVLAKPEMKAATSDVLDALRAFEAVFERLIRRTPLEKS
jgi:ppGpp synthetase/RelA/SpoT-type nucleotidyltranferase